MDKIKRYETLIRQVESLVEGESNVVGMLANVSAAMRMAFPETYFWVGFYLVNGDELRLGPFQGTVACYTIKRGNGVCGIAWQEKRTVIVPDVEVFPGHIACSALSRSEIVVPIFDDKGIVIGVIDIDSDKLNMFDEADELHVKKVADIISKALLG